MNGFLNRVRNFLSKFRQDLRKPLPGLAGKSFFRKISARFRYMFKNYGWKLFVLVIAYYLIRDLVVYIILPYFIVNQIVG